MFAFLASFIFLPFILFEWGDVLLPEAASEHGSDYDNLMWISFALIFLFKLLPKLITLFFFKYRGEKGKKALFYADNDRLRGYLDHYSSNHFSRINLLWPIYLDQYHDR